MGPVERLSNAVSLDDRVAPGTDLTVSRLKTSYFVAVGIHFHN